MKNRDLMLAEISVVGMSQPGCAERLPRCTARTCRSG